MCALIDDSQPKGNSFGIPLNAWPCEKNTGEPFVIRNIFYQLLQLEQQIDFEKIPTGVKSFTAEVTLPHDNEKIFGKLPYLGSGLFTYLYKILICMPDPLITPTLRQCMEGYTGKN